MRKRTRPISRISSLLGVLLLLAGPTWAQTGTTDARTCVATAADPTYVEGTRNPLSCRINGLLRTDTGGGGGGGLTDAELRATPVPISGTVTATGPLTDAQLRAAPVPMTDAGVGATGDAAATVGSTGSLSAKLRLITSQLDALMTELLQKTEPANTQIVGDGAGPLTVDGTVTANAGTNLNTSALALETSVDGLEGGVGAAADAAATVGSTGSLSAKLRLLTSQIDAIQTAVQLIDNAISGAGFNITQLGGANVSMNTGVRDAGTQRVTIATNDVVPVSQSGTWTVQPGNTPNTSPWLTESIKVASASNDGACPSGAANTTALASNASRRGAYMAASGANSDAIYVKLGVTATSSDFRLEPGQALNLTGNSIYTGQVDFLPASSSQALCVIELN